MVNRWAADDDHYVRLAAEAPSVLDVGCGTGRLLAGVRAAGHGGRLVGLDPDRAALDVARRTEGVERVEGTAEAMTWRKELAPATMTGHAFQRLVTDEEVAASLRAVHRALVPGGRFAFEARNPAARAWERWDGRTEAVVDPAGAHLDVVTSVLAVEGDVVTLRETIQDQRGAVLRVDEARLRFLDPDALGHVLATAGFSVETWHGDLAGGPFLTDSPEIVVVAVVRDHPAVASVVPTTPRRHHRPAGQLQA